MSSRPIAYFDIECYKNYFLIKFLYEDTKEFEDYPMFDGKELDRLAVLQRIQKFCIVGFNSQNYDVPMLAYALAGGTCAQLKKLSDEIIIAGLKPWTIYDSYGINLPQGLDHIDVMEVLPGVRIGLKNYGGIAHSHTIQDLPIDPSAEIDAIGRIQLSKYCGNDLLLTRDCYKVAVEKNWISLRESITLDIGTDVRSKSDAQIAEAVVKAKLGFKPQKRFIPNGYQFRYNAPECISFQSDQLKEVLRIATNYAYTVNDKEQTDEASGIKSGIVMPSEIKAIRVSIGSSTYKFGSGGLHSQESGVKYETTGTHVISDHDVASFYPCLILFMGIYPEQCGPKLLEIYRDIYKTRIAAKKTNKMLANSLKIVLNGLFGKLGSKYSIFFAPEMLIQVTITGQLMLLMLIEALEATGISVRSANTDGIVLETPRGMEHVRDAVIAEWERTTTMTTEATFYSGIYLRDVNNYFAVTTDGEIKRKGVFTPPGIGSGPSSSKAPHREICYDAAIAHIVSGAPIAHTIYRCQDVRKFVSVKNVKGGAAYQGEFVGKTVRWVYRADSKETFNYKTNGNQVADSEGACPLMTLPEGMPDWLDYEYYIRHAERVVAEVGVTGKL